MPDASPPTAVVLANLGTPMAPTPRAVRRYLAEFLHDHRVVQLTRWLWCPLLHFVILPLRGPKVARKYAAVWIDGPDGGSPLEVHTRELARAVAQRMPGVRVLHAMRYGEPALSTQLARLAADGVARTLVLPLYPQYSTSTTASMQDVADAHARTAPGIRVVRDYHLDPAWVAAVAASIDAHRAAHGAGEHLVFSLHGLPQRLVDAGDPYAAQCEAGVRAIARAAGLEDGAWTLAYQSRFGRERWLGPSTQDTLAALQARGVRTIDVVAPGFAVDCLETLEEIGMQLAEEVHARGGTLRRIDCLNASPAHADALAAIARAALEAP